MNVSQMDCGNQNPQYVSSFNTIERRNRVVFHIDNFLIVNRVNLSIDHHNISIITERI